MLGALLLAGLVSATLQQEVLIFEEKFDTFNLSLWKHELTLSGEGNWEFEWYTNNRSVSFVRNGSLVIRPTLTNVTLGDAGLMSADVNIWGGDPATQCTNNGYYGCEREGGAGGNIINPIQSARIRTAETFAFRYGRVEVMAKMPRGDWLWPAIWLMPVNTAYGQWPASGEIDILESRGNSPGYLGTEGCNTFSSTLHWGPFWPQNGYDKTHAEYTLPSGDLSQAFHNYTLDWQPGQMTTYIDGVPVLSVPINQTFWQRGGWSENPTLDNPWQDGGVNAPFDQRFYLIINLAVGGTNGFWPDGAGKPWENAGAHAANDFWQAANQWCAFILPPSSPPRPPPVMLASTLSLPPPHTHLPLQTPRGQAPSWSIACVSISGKRTAGIMHLGLCCECGWFFTL
jgi:beta-glucanase (GH16 family)